METDIYKIKTGVFEGPFGLLLDLIEKRKLFINDLSLAEVTDDYLKHLNQMGVINVAEASNFIVVAATLILIKSKSLLPNLSLTEEEKGDIKSLEERLRLYEMFKKLSLNVKSNFGKQIIFAPLERKRNIVVFLPDEQITKASMMALVGDALGRVPKKTVLPEVEVRKVISIEEMIDKLTDRIKSSLRINFKDFSGKIVSREDKVSVIVSFLAMLELVRQGILNALQENHGEDIIIEKQENLPENS
ncbi:segregation/condensation protein A [Candidatus Nomurabacteria bacterium]|nr:segregation/condensation protein A [Candidatus Nomurabacteria bacterium]